MNKALRLDWLWQGNRGLWLSLTLFAVLAAASWVGFIASDDATYIRGAYGWLEHFPYVGGHGTIRYPITVPIALSFLAFGENEYAAVVPSVIYLLVFLVVIWRAICLRAGAGSALVALLLTVTCPLIVIQSTIAGVDVIELALLFGAFLLFLHCLEHGPRPAYLMGAGALAGIAFLTRETAIFVVPFFGVLFALGHRMKRIQYLWIPLGFVAVWLCEVAYLTIMTGDPLYRINISRHHDATIDRGVDLAGNVLVHPLIDPLLVLFANQEFMLIFLFTLPFGGWLCWSSQIEPRLQHFARLLAFFSLNWLVCVGAAQHLLPLNPRYFMIVSTGACLLTGIAIAQLLKSDRKPTRLVGAASLAVIVGTNLLGIYVENKQPIFGEKRLLQLLEEHPDWAVSTDPMTLERAAYLLRWKKLEGRVTANPPRSGVYYYYNPDRSANANARMSTAQLPLYQPAPGSQRLATFGRRPDVLMRLIERLGLYRALPGKIWDKLQHRGSTTYLYRIAGGQVNQSGAFTNSTDEPRTLPH